MTITLLTTSDITNAPGESNGILELAINEFGIDNIWIVSTRTAVGPHDEWWTRLVPGSQTLMHGHDLAKRWKDRIFDHFRSREDVDRDELEYWIDDWEGMEPRGPSSTPYLVWAMLLGIDWPVHHGRPDFWYAALGTLRKQGTIRLNRDILKLRKPGYPGAFKHPKVPEHRNGTCITCGCASGECECLTSS